MQFQVWFSIASDTGVSTSQMGSSTCSKLSSVWRTVRTNGPQDATVLVRPNLVEWLCSFHSVAANDGRDKELHI